MVAGPGTICGTFRKFGYLVLGGPYNQDPTIKGTILGSPIFGNRHMWAVFYVRDPFFGPKSEYGTLINRALEGTLI